MPDLPAPEINNPRYGTIPWDDQSMTRLNHYLPEKSNTLSLQEWTLILVIDLLFLHVMLLLKLPFADLKNALFTILVFYVVLLLTKKLIHSYRTITVGLHS